MKVKKIFYILPLILIPLAFIFAQSADNFFWDSVQPLSEKHSYFPLSLSDSKNSYIFYQKVDKNKKEIKISWRRKEEGLDWSDTFSLADSFKYSGDQVPDMYSAALSSTDRLAVSVIDSSSVNSVVKVYASQDKAQTFQSFIFPPQDKQITSSRIFATSSGGFILFISLGEGKQSPTESSFSILYSESDDGVKWSEPKIFRPSQTIANAFSPFFTNIKGRDFVFFEGWSGRDSTTSLIYGTYREKSASSWSEPFLLTDENSMNDNSKSYLDCKNYRPFVLSNGMETKIVWERTEKTEDTASVMVAPLDDMGKILDKNDVESLNSFGNGRRPSLFLFNNKFYALWFDDRNGVNNVHLSVNLGVQWTEIESVSRRQDNKKNNAFPCAIIFGSENQALFLAWQEERDNESRIVHLSEDYQVAMPDFKARNFTVGKRGNVKNPAVKVNMPKDISGIAGWCGIWTKNPLEEPDADMLSSQFRTTDDNVISAKVPEDSLEDLTIYFKARVMDKAGNWSQTASLSYYYDQTPPDRVSDIYFDKDELGFASSNDTAFSWKMNENDDEIAGYSWTLSKIASIDKGLAVSKKKKLSLSPEESQSVIESLIAENEEKISKAKIPSKKVMGKNPSASFRNRDNGLYVFSVRAIDSVGNAGQVEKCLLVLNKYKAATLISNVNAKTDDFGNVGITITGQEFSYDGEISQVILTNRGNGQKFIFNHDSNDYKIEKEKGDREKITGIRIDGMEAGKYSVQIRHSERGLSTWASSLVIGENGTVKYEKQFNFEPIWQILPEKAKKYNIKSDSLLFLLLMVLIFAGILISLRGLLLTAGDAMKIKREVNLVLSGDYMEKEEIEKLETNMKVRFSLRVKFGFAITALLLFIVAGVALVIGFQMSRTQERILIEGLKNRVQVVMGNMSSGLQSYLDDGREKLVEIGAIVNQVDNFAEAEHATILSYNIDGILLKNGNNPIDYVWASNDENILKKIDADVFDAGTVRYENNRNFILDFVYSMNEKGVEIVKKDLSRTTGDASALIFKELNELSAKSYVSYPEMPDDSLDRAVREYYFYWPVMYQKGSDNKSVVQAIIAMKVSTDTLVKQVDSSQRIVMSIALLAALVAAIIALISAFALSAIIVSPIKRIVTHVKRITETENKLLLENVEIKITSHDELRTLGDSVNEMTKGLVKGAKDEERAKIAYQRAAREREKAAKAQAEEARARAEAAEMNIMNMDGQAVQKAFIPLVSEGSEKDTVAELKEKDIQVYGYYEGTDAVSGDYFDYKKLDDRWYAFIKCDASGHGVPAALIMTIVATIFRRYFNNWKFEKNGVKLNLLAADINDFIESLGLRGKFAAMMICLLDTKSGDVYTCNAGDNILRVFDSVEKKIKVITLHEAPAAGPLPSFMVEMKGGYKVEKIKLKKDDVLFLYTDGIEESTRFFRNEDFEIVECDEPSLKEGEVHDTHKKGEVSEQMEPKRVQDIIEAVLNRKKYILHRYHSPVAGEKLEFDFSKCQGTIEEAIIALTAVEKVFRMYKKPDSVGKVEKTEMDLDGKMKTIIQISGDGIKIDRKIDKFLSEHFNLYNYYCVNKVDEGEANYVYYTGVSEDVQADDLTLLAIKRM
ncbi:MAG: SpoIIE family protein phosphatase [Treponema sp.]|nr:SpoIIE family protein phosphatase [Treponema sp.]